MPSTACIANSISRRGLLHRIGLQRHLAETAGNIEHIVRHRQARQFGAQVPHQRQPFFNPNTEMGCSRRQVGMMQVIGLDAVLDKSAHQVGQDFRLVVDTLEQHGLADQRHAAIHQACDCFLGFG